MLSMLLNCRGPKSLPELPEFQLSLKPDDYELPELDPAWETPQQMLKEHINHGDKKELNLENVGRKLQENAANCK